VIRISGKTYNNLGKTIDNLSSNSTKFLAKEQEKSKRTTWKMTQKYTQGTAVKDRLHLGNKNKNFVFYFVFHSVCTIFAGEIIDKRRQLLR
jgi:hypothetical protein